MSGKNVETSKILASVEKVALTCYKLMPEITLKKKMANINASTKILVTKRTNSSL